MKSLKPLCDHYFGLFVNKNVDELSKMFSDNIKLVDWEVSLKGKDGVLKNMIQLFDSVDDIKIEVGDYIEECYSVSCQLTIYIRTDKNIEEIEIVDIITFDELMKIKKIKAYKI